MLLKIWLCAVFGFVAVRLAMAHVMLAYPPPTSPLDFVDNVRTSGLCGDDTTGTDGSNYWRRPAVDNETMTTLPAGETVEVSWYLHYAHQGGWMFELFDTDLSLVSSWNDSSHWDCSSDGTQQSAVLRMPQQPCRGCILRMQRQALEWGPTYLFRSCALVDVVKPKDSDATTCGDCSGHGQCVEGKCKCDNSPAKGFWYGAYCERQNECDADNHCGSGGLCVDTGALTPPRKQCYCKKGWFGDEEQPWKGMSKLTTRKCSRKSELQLGDPAKWDEEYPFQKRSPGAGTFTLFYKVDGDEIEFAMRANTTNWVAVGFRAGSVKGQAAPALPAAGAGTGGSTGEPSAEPATEPAAAGSEEGWEPEDDCEEYEEGPELEKVRKGGKKSSKQKDDGSRRLLGTVAQMPVLEDEAEEDLQSDSFRHLTVTSDPAEDLDKGESEAQAKKAQPKCRKSKAQEPAAEAEVAAEGTGDAGGCDAGDPVTVNLDEGIHLVEAAEKKKRGLLGSMPMLIPEKEEEPLVVGRTMLQTAAPAASEPAATATGGDAIAAQQFASGTQCENTLVNDPTAHPMINQDIVLAYARGEAFRIQDSFTPSRSRPLPDASFGGKDDILDAVGAEDSDGVTSIKFRRKLSTADTTGDYCILDTINYLMIYAFGQETDNYSHTPNSSLETGRASNRAFYGQDELKYHGGGIGVAHEGRGVMGVVDFFEQPQEGGVCAPSTMEGYECMVQVIPGTYLLHWKAEDDKVNFAAEASGTGWVAVAWPENAGQMIGSVAVIGWTGDAGDEVGVFKLAGKDPTLIQVADESFDIADVEVEETGGKTILKFSRVFDDSFLADADHDLLGAFHASTDAIAYHGPANKAPTTVNFMSVPGDVTDSIAPADSAAAKNVQEVSVNGATVTEGSSVQCTPSGLEGYEDGCMEDTGIGYRLHWRLDDGKVHIAGEADGTGWVAVAWTESPGTMIGSTAVLGWTGSQGDQVDIYKLTAKDASGILSEPSALELDPEDTFIEETSDSRTILHFSRLTGPDFDANADQNLVVAFHPATDGIEYHGFATRTSITINFGSGSSVLSAADENLSLYWKIHGWLMVVGWGILIPIGMIIARTMKDRDPLWFYTHVFVQSTGLCITIVAWVIALLKFEPEFELRHRQVGTAVMVMGIAQPLLAMKRPHKGQFLRMYWEWMHWTIGRGAILMGAWNIFMGIARYRFLAEVTSHKYEVMYGLTIGALGLVYIALESRAERIRHTRYTKVLVDRIDALEMEAGFRRAGTPGKGAIKASQTMSYT